ncbi:MAG TPA: copper homeostasis membrane protein CopD [Xanthobacteraceae bacterium]
MRAIHFIATMVAAGAVFFAAFVAEPAFQDASPDERLVAAFRRRLTRIVWISLVVAVVSGLAWLILTTQEISDRPLAAVFSEGVIWTVLARTGFGHAWLVRLVPAVLLAAMLLLGRLARQDDMHRIAAAALAAALAGTLAWAGHAVGTPGTEGIVHLTADVLHLVAAAAWVGGLAPLVLLLHAARGDQSEMLREVAQKAVLRFSTLGVASVAALLASGIVNTWFLAGSVPALAGTGYGRLLLVKIALFLAMVSIAAVNRFRLRPRLVKGEPIVAIGALRQLERNSALEAGVGAIILVIVAVLGTIPPGLHEQPIWPLPFRINAGVFGEPDFYVTLAFGAAWIAAGVVLPRFRWPAIAIGAVIYLLMAWRLPTEEAYPTTYYGSPTGFSAQSIAQGEGLFAAHCASCHGQQARGDGPAGAALKTKPSDLIADHVYEHTDGDLLWWITHGLASGMPAFGDLLPEQARWNLIDFIRANADATRFRVLSAGTTAAFPAPDFSAGCPDGSTLSIARLSPQIAHVVVAGAGLQDWLRRVAERDIADKLRTVVIASSPEAAKDTSLCVARETETIRTFALYRGAEPLEGTEFLIDAAGNLRSMWRADDTANGGDAIPLERRIQGLRSAARVHRPSGMQGHTHTH